MRLLPLLLLPACILVTDEEWDRAVDRDRDGYMAAELGGDDCDDAAATVNPGLGELCGDNVDNDCDGAVDDVGLGAIVSYADADADGFGSADASVTACGVPLGHVTSLAAGADCDDRNDTIHPAATETWYDGVDADCDGADDHDQDGDGFTALGAPGGTADDCDDDPTDDTRVGAEFVHPGSAESWYDGIDQDCDGNDWDQDGDGFTRAGAPVGSSDDCDDDPTDDVATSAAVVHPGAPDACYDGRDDDCDQWDDWDCDHDGYAAFSDPGGDGDDCRDDVVAVNPGQIEVCNNHLDDDCDTTDNGCRLTGALDFLDAAPEAIDTDSLDEVPYVLSAADGLGGRVLLTRLVPSSIGVFEFEAVVAVEPRQVATFTNSESSAPKLGDFNGDGADDVLWSSAATFDPSPIVSVFAGPFDGTYSVNPASRFETTVLLPVQLQWDNAWAAGRRAAEDRDDVYVIGPDGGYIVQPPITGESLDSPVCTVESNVHPGPRTLLAACETASGQGPRLILRSGGDLRVAEPPLLGPHLLDGDLYLSAGEITVRRAWCRDVDLDGEEDLILDIVDVYSGVRSLHMALLPLGRPTSLDEAAWVFDGGTGLDIADLDGDGVGDLVVSLPSTEEIGVYYGPFDVSDPLAGPPDATLTDAWADSFGPIWAVGDLDGDGFDEFAWQRGELIHIVRGRGM